MSQEILDAEIRMRAEAGVAFRHSMQEWDPKWLTKGIFEGLRIG
jgi:hypothetical protein